MLELGTGRGETNEREIGHTPNISNLYNEREKGNAVLSGRTCDGGRNGEKRERREEKTPKTFGFTAEGK